MVEAVLVKLQKWLTCWKKTTRPFLEGHRHSSPSLLAGRETLQHLIERSSIFAEALVYKLHRFKCYGTNRSMQGSKYCRYYFLG